MMVLRRDEGDEALRHEYADHFVLSARSACWVVSALMARHVEACLDRWPPRRWIVFVDLSGSRIRIRREEIEYVVQSTAEQRARDRAFARAMRRERKADEEHED